MHIGIDMVKINRLKIDNSSFLDKILSEDEKKIFEKEKNKKEFLAGRFALKEAIIKTFEGKKKVLMNEIKILRNKNGLPMCEYKDYKIIGSISHEDEYAVAVAIRME